MCARRRVARQESQQWFDAKVQSDLPPMWANAMANQNASEVLALAHSGDTRQGQFEITRSLDCGGGGRSSSSSPKNGCVVCTPVLELVSVAAPGLEVRAWFPQVAILCTSRDAHWQRPLGAKMVFQMPSSNWRTCN